MICLQTTINSTNRSFSPLMCYLSFSQVLIKTAAGASNEFCRDLKDFFFLLEQLRVSLRFSPATTIHH